MRRDIHLHHIYTGPIFGSFLYWSMGPELSYGKNLNNHYFYNYVQGYQINLHHGPYRHQTLNLVFTGV
jgi:hypothetical protein